MRSLRIRHRALAASLAAGSIVALSACGGSSDAAGGEIASLQTDDEVAEEQELTSEVVVSADDAALEFSECLRAEGLDVADIGVDAEGNIDVRSALENVEPGSEGFREAMQSCREILEGVGFGGRGGPGGLADNTEIADAMLEFSDCIRDHGFEDVADLTLGRPVGAGGGGGGAPEGGPPAGGQGNREGGFGDRSTLFAERMGLDPEDPDVIAATDACMPIVDDAFAAAGIGEGPGT